MLIGFPAQRRTRGMRLNMKFTTLAVVVIAAALAIFAARSGKQDSDATGPSAATAAAAPASPIKTVTSNSCASDGCPVSCEADDTLLSAFCVSGSKARFADTLKLANGKLSATCGMGASSILMYCGRP
jgi:hypothetical protein